MNVSACPSLVSACGTTITIDVERCCGEPSPAERRFLDRLRGPALDIGCGPGRITAHLHRRDRAALGLDASAGLVARAQANGALCVHQSVFDPVPFEGRWYEAILLDGNIGIGGDPQKLLDRVRRIVRPHGRAYVEVGGPDVRTQQLVVREHHHGLVGEPFPWAQVSVSAVDDLLVESGWRLEAVHTVCDRAGERFDTRFIVELERMT